MKVQVSGCRLGFRVVGLRVSSLLSLSPKPETARAQQGGQDCAVLGFMASGLMLWVFRVQRIRA